MHICYTVLEVILWQNFALIVLRKWWKRKMSSGGISLRMNWNCVKVVGNIKRSLLWKEDYQECKRRYFLKEKFEKKKKTTHRVDLLSLFGFRIRLHFLAVWAWQFQQDWLPFTSVPDAPGNQWILPRTKKHATGIFFTPPSVGPSSSNPIFILC